MFTDTGRLTPEVVKKVNLDLGIGVSFPDILEYFCGGYMFLWLLIWGFVFNRILLNFVRQELVLIAECYSYELLEGRLNCCKNTLCKYWITKFDFFFMVKCLLSWSQVIRLCFPVLHVPGSKYDIFVGKSKLVMSRDRN